MKHSNNHVSIPTLVTALTLACLCQAEAATVALQNATATYSQTTDGAGNPQAHPVSAAIDGNFGVPNPLDGWAIYEDTGILGVDDQTHAQTAVFETVSDVGFLGSSIFTFRLFQTQPNHLLGRFRFSVTTDNRSTFADGLESGGDVTANWVVLNPSALTSANGVTLTELGDFSILASGFAPSTDTYTITAPTTLTGITGVRLEVLEDSSLPFNGPGSQVLNGNFTLTEFTVDIVPEPSTATLGLFGILVAASRRRRNERTAQPCADLTATHEHTNA